MARKKTNNKVDPQPEPETIEETVHPLEGPTDYIMWIARFVVLVGICYIAYDIRLFAVKTYGNVIHEFDPWFNYRATEYLVENGLSEFFNWFDDKSWYPIGRHVGSTVYPGLMMTAAYIHKVYNYFLPISVNDVCVYIPAWFGAISTLFTYGLTKEVTSSPYAGLCAGAIMSILPAHLMRSVAGGYDNESIALTAMIGTFYFWVRSLRSKNSWVFGIPTGFMYIYMVAAWGGYPFVLNMVGVHTAVLLLLGRFSDTLHRSYTLFFIIGTVGALQFEIVGTMPLTSLEQMGPLGVFFMIQIFKFLDYNQKKMTKKEFSEFRKKVIVMCVLAGAVALGVLEASGHLGSLSTRVRSLFIRHTKTGNPLVDSVAEHQATPARFYYIYFHFIITLAPIGFVFLFYQLNDVKFFGLIYLVLSYYFSQKMVRLVLLLSPAAAMSSGLSLYTILKWCYSRLNKANEDKPKPSRKQRRKQSVSKDLSLKSFIKNLDKKVDPVVQNLIAIVFVVIAAYGLYSFYIHSTMMATQISEPQIILRSRKHDGSYMIIDDFRLSYWWLRDNTPEDSRVMAWWDYGYQINGVANRTTIADGNTWNHEHIALLGKCLVSEEEQAWKITRHLADYVLVWTTRFAGMWGDDLAKMPHMANIAGSVFPEIEQRGYFVDRDGRASPLAEKSLLYQLTFQGFKPEVPKPKHYEEVYTSPYRMVRIYKVLNTAERPPAGQYPPHLLNAEGKIGQFK
eukprot:TRINITY_DN3413_c0_g1_i1.p1 TRINITY_DN3413_c0_g1~~TRINITY_DN3413_c0_g1_i1.p1  ORF type:complete len:733 (-),score=138.09 TRINITY_DN3413_c0_g1_i1:25-2223(-)